MSDIVIRVENLTKEYRLGTISHGTLREDLQSWWARMRGKEDPNSIIGAKSGEQKTPDSQLSAPSSQLQAPSSKLSAPSSQLSAPLNPHFLALDNVSFDVKRGEAVGIIGRNGAGKSTLLKILSRVTAPTSGEVKIKGRVASLLEVGTGFHPELTGRENIFLNGTILGMKRPEIQRKFDEIVAFAEIDQFIDTPVKRYSSGMYVRLAFAVAAHLEPEILIVDEVLAVGDAAFQKKCLGKMQAVGKEGRTILFVSHNMNMIDSLCNKSIFLKEGHAHGPFGIKEGINLYLGQSGYNKKIFDNAPLTYAEILQKDTSLELTVEYSMNRDIDLPCLGFVISDYLGIPICGSNPIIDAPKEIVKPTQKGTIRVIIEYPKLLNGTYRLSLWFGDGKEDFFSDKDCLIFDVLNMIKATQLSVSAVGCVFPKCTWYFS